MKRLPTQKTHRSPNQQVRSTNRIDFLSPGRNSMKYGMRDSKDGARAQDTPFEKERTQNSIIKPKRPSPSKDQEESYRYQINQPNFNNTGRDVDYETAFQGMNFARQQTGLQTGRVSIATHLRDSKLPFQPAQLTDSDVINTEDDEIVFDGVKSFSKVETDKGEQLTLKDFDPNTPIVEQGEEDDSFIKHFKQRLSRSDSPVTARENHNLDEMRAEEQSVLTKINEKKNRRQSHHSRQWSDYQLSNQESMVAAVGGTQQTESKTSNRNREKASAKEIGDITDLFAILKQSNNQEFVVNGVTYKMKVPNRDINKALSGSRPTSIVNHSRKGSGYVQSNRPPSSSNKSASASSPKPMGPWMNSQQSPKEVRPKFQYVKSFLAGPLWSNSMRQLQATSPTPRTQVNIKQQNSEIRTPNSSQFKAGKFGQFKTVRLEHSPRACVGLSSIQDHRIRSLIKQSDEEERKVARNEVRLDIDESLISDNLEREYNQYNFNQQQSPIIVNTLSQKNSIPNNEQIPSPTLVDTGIQTSQPSQRSNKSKRNQRISPDLLKINIPQLVTVDSKISSNRSPLVMPPKDRLRSQSPPGSGPGSRRKPGKVKITVNAKKYPMVSPLEQHTISRNQSPKPKDEKQNSKKKIVHKPTIDELDFDKLNAALDDSDTRTITETSETSAPQHSEHSKASKQMQAITNKYLDKEKLPPPSNKSQSSKQNRSIKSRQEKEEKKDTNALELDPLDDEQNQLFAQSFNTKSEIKGVQNRKMREMQREIERLRYKLDNVENQNEKKRQRNRLHVGYLYASPIIYEDYDPTTKKKGYQSLPQPQLNFVNEIKAIKKVMKQSGQELVFKSNVATKDNFIDMMNKGPRVLHITCHGISTDAFKMIENYEEMVARGNCLLFETTTGQGELVSQIELQKLIFRTWPDLDVVFVAACNSEFVGKIFLKCGARHVICVKTDQYVLDDATIQFTEQFYEKIINGTEICEAFESAKAVVESKQKNAKEADLFIKFTKEQAHTVFNPTNTRKSLPHDCESHAIVSAGEFKCISDHVQFKFIPSKLQNIKFRDKEMWNLISDIMNGHRLVILLGLHGVGKSCLARNALHYMSERKFFTGGVVLVQLSNLKEVQSCLKRIQAFLFRALDLTKDQINELTKETCSLETLILFITNFFNNKLEYRMKKQKNISSQTKKFLLCFDNAEDLIANKLEDFKLLLTRLTDDCPNLSIIITSNKGVGVGRQLPNLRTQFLEQLRSDSSVQLFFDMAQKKIMIHDIVDLIVKDKSFPIHKIIPSYNEVPEPVTPEFRKQLSKRFELRSRCIEALSYHDLFDQLQGNPQSIVMLAAAFSNPYTKDNSLTSLYGQVSLDMSRSQEEELFDSGKDNSYQKKGNGIRENYIAMKCCAEASIQLLESSKPECLNLLYFLGCLPGGVNHIQLKEMWGDDQEQLETLRKLSFLDLSEEPRIAVTSFIKTYVQQSMVDQDKAEFMRQICEYYIDLLAEFFKTNSCNLAEPLTAGLGTALLESIPSYSDKLSAMNSVYSDKQGEGTSSTSVKRGHKLKDILQDRVALLTQTSRGEGITVFQQVIDELLNIEHCLEHFMDVSVKCAEEQKNQTQQIARPEKQNEQVPPLLGQIADLEDQEHEFERDESGDLSPVPKGGFPPYRPSSNFDYDPNRSFRNQMAPKKSSDEGGNSPGPFSSQAKVHSPAMTEKHSAKSKSIADSKTKPSSFEDFCQGTVKKNATPSILEVIDEQAESDPKNFYSRIPSFMSSIESQRARESMPEKPSIGVTNLDQTESKSGTNSDLYEQLLSEMKGQKPKTGKHIFDVEDADQDGGLPVFEHESPPRMVSDVQKFQGTISLGIGERLLSARDTDEDDFKLSESNSIHKSEHTQQSDDEAEEQGKQKQQTSSQMFNTMKPDDLRARLSNRRTKKTDEGDLGDLSASQLFETNLTKVNSGNWGKRKMTKQDLRSELEGASNYILPKSNLRRVDNRGSIRGTGRARRSRTSRKQNSAAMEVGVEEMKTQSRFILLMAANIFLSGDYEYCLWICSHNFSYVANTSLFEGNILRFKSLAAEQLFLHMNLKELSEAEGSSDFLQVKSAVKSTGSNYRELSNLFLAVESAHHALDVYRKGSLPGKQSPNYYGMALQHFQLGYLYEKYSEALSSDQARQLEDSQHSQYLMGDQKEHNQKASTFFDLAYDDFKRLNHLKGMYLAKLHNVNLQDVGDDNPQDLELKIVKKKQLIEEVWSLKEDYEEYVNKYGFSNCPHIPREHGEDTSLMVEIIEKNEQTNLFQTVQSPESARKGSPHSRKQTKRLEQTRTVTIAEADAESNETSLLSGTLGKQQPDFMMSSHNTESKSKTLESRDSSASDFERD